MRAAYLLEKIAHERQACHLWWACEGRYRRDWKALRAWLTHIRKLERQHNG